MNFDECNLTNVDLQADPVEWVVAAYTNFMSSKIICPMEVDGTLCGEAGSEVVAVYKFKGNFEQVFSALTQHMIQITHEVPTEDMREKLMELIYSHIDYRESGERINPHYVAYTKAKRSGDLMLVGEMFEKYVEWNLRMHTNKQCLCFCNG